MERLSAVIKILGTNLLGYDMIIILLSAINFYCYFIARRTAKQLYETMHMTFFIPEHITTPEDLPKRLEALEESNIVGLRMRAESYYSIFVNFTAIFPLLGILGTVISLIPMVMDMANMQQNFFAALTSTLWGLVFAIIFKVLDAFLASVMEDNDKNVKLYLERNIKRGRENECEIEES